MSNHYDKKKKQGNNKASRLDLSIQKAEFGDISLQEQYRLGAHARYHDVSTEPVDSPNNRLGPDEEVLEGPDQN